MVSDGEVRWRTGTPRIRAHRVYARVGVEPRWSVVELLYCLVELDGTDVQLVVPGDETALGTFKDR